MNQVHKQRAALQRRIMQPGLANGSLNPMGIHRHRSLDILLLIGLGAALGAGAVLWLESSILEPRAMLASSPTAASSDAPIRCAATASYRDAVARAAPSVVNLYARHLRQPKPSEGRRQPLPGERSQAADLGPGMGLGAAVVVDDGLLVTNGHLLMGADRIDARLADGSDLEVRLLGIDPDTDLAVLSSDDPDLPQPLVAADPHQLAVGDLVLAIGNPFGMGQTTSLGVVGGIGRHHLGLTAIERFIQTDAAINPGSSGGALIDTQGRLVGINTAILSETGVSAGIGFAIPVDLMLEVVEQITRNGQVERGWIGIGGRSVTPALCERFGLRTASGVLVSSLAKDSPAERAGLRRGDVVTGIDGEVIDASVTLRDLIVRTGPDKTISLEFWRGSQRLEIETRTALRPTETAPSPSEATTVAPASDRLLLPAATD
jgi:S1-C subfamily serine protease